MQNFKELNRYNNIISFFFNLNERLEGARGLFVIYDSDENLDKMLNFPSGKPFSHVGSQDRSVMIYLKKWLNPQMKKIINEKNYCQLTIVDVNFNSKETHIVDVLLEVLNYINF
jgi:hypothetical protein